MYTLSSKTIADVADVTTLCTWAKNDPPDSKELERNNKIEQYQKNRNPYIDNNYWLTQAWGCPDIPLGVLDRQIAYKIKIYPNPANNIINIEIEKAFNDGRMAIYNMLGKEILRTDILTTGKLQIDLTEFQAGFYVLSIYSADGTHFDKAIFSKK